MLDDDDDDDDGDDDDDDGRTLQVYACGGWTAAGVGLFQYCLFLSDGVVSGAGTTGLDYITSVAFILTGGSGGGSSSSSSG